MLIYNFQKEFLGIDAKDLKTLGFKDLAGLRTEVTDFADLFVKTPGYVHNFKHVHWIDFITCAESSEESKVIINVNNKNFKCTLHITIAFLVDSPLSKAYIVTLNNLRELNTSESERISGDIIARELPQEVSPAQQIFNTPEVSDDFDTHTIEEDPYETPIVVDLDVEDELLEESNKEETFEEETLSIDLDDTLEIDEPLDIDFEDEPSVTSETQTVQEDFDNGYTYDPKVASDELGLPLDLIEEFIQDFIEQAKEFKDNLYKALEEQDTDNLRILSHKLKGVAANLRIEDALETLTIINTSDDLNIAEDNLNTFYQIISKLSGEEIVVEKKLESIEPQELIEESELDTDALDLSFKDELEEDLYSDPVEIQEEISVQEDVLAEVQELEETPQEPKAVYAKDIIANEIGIDSESFNELFDDYIEEANELNRSIQTAIQSDDLVTCKNEALKLKGMSDNMRINTFSDDLEAIIHANSTQGIQENLNNIVTAIAELSN